MAAFLSNPSAASILSEQRYGKDKVRLVKVTDLPPSPAAPHLKHQHVQELTVRVLLSGTSFTTSYTAADNSLVVPTDTVKNTVYFLAQQTDSTLEDIEVFGGVLARHFLATYAHVDGVHVRIAAHDWTRLTTSTVQPTTASEPGSAVSSVAAIGALPTAPHPHAFTRAGDYKRTTQVTATRTAVSSPASAASVPAAVFTIVSGLADFYVLKSTGSSFENYHTDALTTLPPMAERILSTDVSVVYRYRPFTEPLAFAGSRFGMLPFTQTFKAVRQITVDMFANHDSPSVQNTLYRMGDRVLAVCPDIVDVKYELPNKHVFVYDLGRFGLVNQTGKSKSTVYYPVADPSGLITATISRPSTVAASL
ncbi:hypothetical protein BC831DRAFT_453431 [Entophlyctis helioformis]|nr:hypothetical protein BC831DRAFT_453431 [Entophlyctis helioformis]